MATRFVPLDTTWILVSTGPSTLQVRGGSAFIATGLTPPLPTNTIDCYVVSNTFSYSGVQNVYARITYDPPATDVGVVVDDAYSM